MKKVLFICAVFLALGLTTVSAQSQKMKEKATEKVEELNNQIIAGDKSLALSDEQKKEILEVHIERLKTVKQYKKAGSDKAELKEINKKYYKKIYNSILTKAQKKAKKEGKDKLKN